jgi:ABC-2 type transport system ATP-binding protein
VTEPAATRDAGIALRTVGLTKTYGRLVALDHLDLELRRGDLFGFIGPNGAGKTTTMRILCGLLEASTGRAEVLGRDVSRNGPFVRKHVGYMPDSFGVYEDLTVAEYLEFFASAYGVPRARRRTVIGEVLELTDLTEKRDAGVDSLSRGMQQRLGLARVLVHDPPVLLLDEPASGLDPRARIEIRELLRELQRMGKTILISSHILSELGEFCNRLGIIERGKLVIAGTLDELVRRARAKAPIGVRVLGGPPEAERAAGVLKGDGSVESVQVLVVNDGDARAGELLVTLADGAPHHHGLIERLAAAGVRIDAVAPHQLKLEDVFLRLTRGIVP